MKKLIAIDLDGTTLNQDSIITDKTAKTLRRAIEDGHSVVIATGRPYRMSKNFYQQLQLTTPMINFNGALVHLPGKKWADEQETSVNRKIVFDVMSEKKNLKLDFIAAENRGHEVEVNTWGGPNPMLEVVAKGIQKAHGLKRMINSLNVQQEDILAFGDEHNDVDMLKFAGWGVSMVNGTDQLKAVADDITEKPNSEDGMADYLTKYLDL